MQILPGENLGCGRRRRWRSGGWRRGRRWGFGCFHCTRRSAARRAAREGQQSDVASALDRDAQPPLMTGANACHAARKDFPAFLDELGKNVGALVIDQVHLLDTKFADFFLAEELAFAAARSARTTWTAGSATFTSWATAWTAFATASSVTSVPAVPTARPAWARRWSRGPC